MAHKRKAVKSPHNQRPATLVSVLTIPELADYLKISQSTLYKLAQEGKVPGQKVGKHWRFHRDAIDEWLKRFGPLSSSTRARTSSAQDLR